MCPRMWIKSRFTVGRVGRDLSGLRWIRRFVEFHVWGGIIGGAGGYTPISYIFLSSGREDALLWNLFETYRTSGASTDSFASDGPTIFLTRPSLIDSDAFKIFPPMSASLPYGFDLRVHRVPRVSAVYRLYSDLMMNCTLHLFFVSYDSDENALHDRAMAIFNHMNDIHSFLGILCGVERYL